MARALVVMGLVVCVVFGWHLYGVADARRTAEDLRTRYAVGQQGDPITVNPVTNVVSVPVEASPEKAKSDNPVEALGSALGTMLGGALARALEPSFERELNLRARENYDLYALLLPYRVRVVTSEDRKTK